MLVKQNGFIHIYLLYTFMAVKDIIDISAVKKYLVMYI